MSPTIASSPRDSGANAPAGTRNYPPDRLALVEGLLKKNMTRIVPSDRPRVPQTPGEIVVLLTGSTGALGSYLLKLLIDDTRIHHIYAHNRPAASKSVYDRQATSFQELGLDVSVLSSSKITLLEGDMRQDNLGLDALVYQNLLQSVTVIVHNAWKLDFKASVSAFVPLITGTVNLINFGHQLHCSKPRLIFSSSITAVQNFGCDGMVPEAIINDPIVSLGCGYGEAKYIVERLIASSRLATCSVRIPQLYGGPPHFIWPITGWLALFVRSSLPLGQLPLSPGLIDWLPMADTALILRDIILHQGELPQATNLRSPASVSFNEVITWVQETLVERSKGKVSLSTTPLERWLEGLGQLQRNGVSIREIPVLSIQTFLRDIVERGRTAKSAPAVGALPLLDTTLACSISPSLGVEPLSKSFVEGWVDYWVRERILVLRDRDSSRL